jgi:hypothetical protein
VCFLLPGYFFNRPCGNQKGSKFWEVVCDKSGIGGNGEFFGDNDAHFDRINVFYHEASGGKYMTSPDNHMNNKRGQKLGQRPLPYKRAEHRFIGLPPLFCCGFRSKLRATHRGASLGPSVCGARAFSLCSLK